MAETVWAKIRLFGDDDGSTMTEETVDDDEDDDIFDKVRDWLIAGVVKHE